MGNLRQGMWIPPPFQEGSPRHQPSRGSRGLCCARDVAIPFPSAALDSATTLEEDASAPRPRGRLRLAGWLHQAAACFKSF